MGLCGSSQNGGGPSPQEAKRSREIDQAMHAAAGEESNNIKLLLLGAGESGKSTLLKQLVYMYGAGFRDDKVLKEYRRAVHRNTLNSIRVLCTKAKLNDDVAGDEEFKAAYARILDLSDKEEEEELTPDLAVQVRFLWGHKVIRDTYQRRSEFQLLDSAEYFLDKVCAVAEEAYKPSVDDILHTRVMTTGIVETQLDIDKSLFTVIDVGGQRNERRKWIHCFDNVTAVIFMVALSAFDQKLREEAGTNRMTEALELWGQTVNFKWQGTAMILFLNKRDLFVEKLKTTNLNVAFADYNGSNEYKDAVGFIEDKFMQANKSNRTVYTHITCATDTDNIRNVFDIVRDIIVRKSLELAGLLDPNDAR